MAKITKIITFAFLFSFVVGLTFLGCTKNVRTKTFGGTMNIALPANQKLINATWKESNLWYLTTAMKTNDYPQVYYFNEVSSFGILEGKIVFTESRK